MRRQPASVVGIDVTQVRLQVAREVVERNGLSEKVQVCFGNATALEFEAETFTRVLAVECAFHFQTRRQFFAEAARVLAPGGRLALTDMIPRRGADVQEFLARVYPVGTGPEFNVPENVYDADQYESFLRAANFDDVRIKDITNMTLPRFAAHLEHLSSQAVGDKARLLAGVAEKYREHLRAGLEYVLVSARKADARK
jgi:microcystin synthetase protein McyJ